MGHPSVYSYKTRTVTRKLRRYRFTYLDHIPIRSVHTYAALLVVVFQKSCDFTGAAHRVNGALMLSINRMLLISSERRNTLRLSLQ